METKPAAPYYSIEALIGSEWTVRFRMTVRSASVNLAKDLAQVETLNYHVYLHTRSGQRKHVFTARPHVEAA
jgi:hypothetical protein